MDRSVRLPSSDDSIAPVMILDAQGHVVRVVSAAEFQRSHPKSVTSWRRTGAHAKTEGTSNETDGDISASE
jgi:hypothetical protein